MYYIFINIRLVHNIDKTLDERCSTDISTTNHNNTKQARVTYNIYYKCKIRVSKYKTAVIRSECLPGVGVIGAGVTGGLIITTDRGAGVTTGCGVIAIIIACITVIIVPSGPITGIANNESPAKTNSPLPPSK